MSFRQISTTVVFSTLSIIGALAQNGKRANTRSAGDSSCFDRAVNVIVVQRDGKMIVGGDFFTYNKLPARAIVRLNTNGSIDSGFVVGGGLNGEVNAIVLQPDGKVIVGGKFSSYDTKANSCNRIVRLNSNGSIDNSFAISIGFKGEVNALALQPDGKILVGGMLANFNGIACGGLVRLNANGSLDQNFVFINGISGYVYSICLLPGGKIMAGGYFGHFDKVLAYGIVRLNNNGTLDNSFDSKKGFYTGSVFTIIPLSNGKILAAGSFVSYNGVPCHDVVRLNNDGSIDNSFAVPGKPTKEYSGYCIRTLVAQSDGKILAGGKFDYYNTTLRQSIVRLNADGSIDNSFGSETAFDTQGHGAATINTIALTPDGNILAGGSYKRYNQDLRNNITALDRSGKLLKTIFPVSGL